MHLLCATDVSVHRVRKKFSQKFRFNPCRLGIFFFFYIFPICIFSDFVISKLAFLIHYFSVSVSELGWIVLQPSSPFRQNHSACSLNSTHFLRVWIYFQIEKNKHSRDTIQEIQELGGWALYPWTGEERQGLGVSGCQ